jgi:ferredoxin
MALCEELAPERFQVQADCRMKVLQPDIEDEEAFEIARKAVSNCPNDAISIVYD